jgi:hypothetical protein
MTGCATSLKLVSLPNASWTTGRYINRSGANCDCARRPRQHSAIYRVAAVRRDGRLSHQVSCHGRVYIKGRSAANRPEHVPRLAGRKHGDYTSAPRRNERLQCGFYLEDPSGVRIADRVEGEIPGYLQRGPPGSGSGSARINARLKGLPSYVPDKEGPWR